MLSDLPTPAGTATARTTTPKAAKTSTPAKTATTSAPTPAVKTASVKTTPPDQEYPGQNI